MTDPGTVSDRPRTVEDLMRRDVITIDPDASVRALARLLQDRGVSGVPVVDDDVRLVGTVSLTDILWLSDRLPPLLHRSGGGEDGEEDAGRGEGGSELGRVRDIMTPDVFGLEPSASVLELLDFFARTGLHRAPVVEEGRLVGIVSASDLLPLITGRKA